MTTDTHENEQQANAVVVMLERDGFGGDGLVFPLRTWVEEVPKTEFTGGRLFARPVE